MSSDLFLLDCSVFADPFSPIDTIFQENYINQSNPTDEIDQITFGNLSLSQMPTTLADFNALLQVKTEDSQFPNYSAFDYNNNNNYNNHSFLDTNAYGGTMKMMQRSFSSNCFEGQPSLLFQPQFDGLMESPNLESFSSPENSSSCSITQMRRICSAGDLQGMKTSQTRARLSCSPLGTENSIMEEANSKVLRYSAEERKERIHRYKTKRTQRNFNKTIKYACRKTLADSRPRIRGRFARNDESGEAHKTAPFNRYEEDDDFWIEGFQMHDQEQDEGALFKSYGVL